jgi:hypothetical protein
MELERFTRQKNWSDLLDRRTGGGCHDDRGEPKQSSWDVATEATASTDVTSSTEASAIEYDRWAYGTNV